MNPTNRYEVALPNGKVHARNDKRTFTFAVVSTSLHNAPRVNLCADLADAEAVAATLRSPNYSYTRGELAKMKALGKAIVPFCKSVEIVAISPVA